MFVELNRKRENISDHGSDDGHQLKLRLPDQGRINADRIVF
jgi:hypothetical protein